VVVSDGELLYVEHADAVDEIQDIPDGEVLCVEQVAEVDGIQNVFDDSNECIQGTDYDYFLDIAEGIVVGKGSHFAENSDPEESKNTVPYTDVALGVSVDDI
jgi:hypothetical protein